MEPGKIDWRAVEEASAEEWILIDTAREVQEALIDLKRVPDTILEDGDSRYLSWVNDTDWLYRCRFDFDRDNKTKASINFKGIDTVADIFLNGEYIGQNQSMYLNFSFRAEKLFSKDNTLLVYFHSHKKMLKLYEASMPEAWKGNVTPENMHRKSRDYGALHGYHPIGLFNDVLLECVDKTAIVNTDINTDFDVDLTCAAVRLSAEGESYNGIVEVRFTIEEEEGAFQEAVIIKAQQTEQGWKADGVIRIQNPRLWWPRNYGDQPMYLVKYEVYADGELCDYLVKMTGLRHVRMVGSMRFEVNGVEIKWWGSGITPMYGLTNRYNHEDALDMLEKIVDCNMNGLRIWGPGRSYPEELYYEFDKRGIMIWQDFPTGTWQLPDSEEYKKIFAGEAVYMIKRLKAHPCIMLWCGGNEHIYMCELYDWKGRIGFELLWYGYRDICAKLDPQRYYHVSSPYEGRYTNDPSFGDSHGSRAYTAYTPGEDYGVFFSEDIRVFPPQYKSAVRFMKEDIWEENYADTKPFGKEFAMPEGWKNHFSNNGHLKLGKIEQYYSATKPQELIYKYAMAAAKDLYEIGAHARTGNPVHRAAEQRQCTGHMFWKFNDPWPRFYCSFYDYYRECTLPYYYVKRVFSPFMIHFEVGDRVHLWGVNDTREDRLGFLTIRIFDIQENITKKEIIVPAAVKAGRSVVLTDLDEFGPIRWESVLYAQFTDLSGNIQAKAHGYVTIENMIRYPDAKLTLKQEEDSLVITADRFARCVELSGEENGDEFGWYFEDNYFDLLPFETKKVKVSGRHDSGIVSAKAHYSDNITRLDFVR
jgi:hypothetical protein